MITEDYVSFETAKLLKEKGIEYDQNESYWLIDADNKMYWVSRIGAYDYVDNPTDSFQRPKNGYRLVTQAVAMKWLRENFNINPVPYALSLGWAFDIFDLSNKDITGCKKLFSMDLPSKSECYNTYEEACEAAIKYCLENLV